jgi:transposase
VLFQQRREQQRIIHDAYRLHGYCVAEIARHLGVHYATVSRRLTQAEDATV